jgi:hypothetical protein
MLYLNFQLAPFLFGALSLAHLGAQHLIASLQLSGALLHARLQLQLRLVKSLLYLAAFRNFVLHLSVLKFILET